MTKWFNEAAEGDWTACRGRIMALLSDEAGLQEIVQLVGMDALSAPDRLKLEAARSIREDFLHQDAFHEVDTYSSLEKQFHMMKLVLEFYDASLAGLKDGVSIDKIAVLPVREQIGRYKYTTEENLVKEYDSIVQEIHRQINELKGEED